MEHNGVDTKTLLGEQTSSSFLIANEYDTFFNSNGTGVFNLEDYQNYDVTVAANASEQGSPSFVTGCVMPESEPGTAVPRNIPGHFGYTANALLGDLANYRIGMENQCDFDALLDGNMQPPVPLTTVSLHGTNAMYAPARPLRHTPSAPTTRSFNQTSTQPYRDFLGHSSDLRTNDPPTSFAAGPYNGGNNNNPFLSGSNTAEAVRTAALPVEAPGRTFLDSCGLPLLPPTSLTPGSQVPAMLAQGYAVSMGGGTPLTPNNPNTPARPTTPYAGSPADWGRGPHSGGNNAALLGIRDEVSPGTGLGMTPDAGANGQDTEMQMPPADFIASDFQVGDLVRQNSQYEVPVSTRIQQMNNPVFVGNAMGIYGSYGSNGSCDPRGIWGNAPQPRPHRSSFTASDSVALGNRNNPVAPLDTMLHAPAPQSAPGSTIGERPASYQIPANLYLQQHIQQRPASASQGHHQHMRQQYQAQQLQQFLQQQQQQQQQQKQQQQHQETLELFSALPVLGVKRCRSETGDSEPGDIVHAFDASDDRAVGSESQPEVDAALARGGPAKSRLRRTPACTNCYLSRRRCDHNTPCERCVKSKDGLPCIQNRQWKYMENIFRNSLPDALMATVDAVLGNKDLTHLPPDKALEKHTGRPIALKAALDVLSVMKFGKSLSYVTYFEEAQARHHTIFGPFYQQCLVLQGRRVLQSSDKFSYTPQFEDDLRMLLALSTARALHFFDKNLEKNKLDKEVPSGRRAHQLVVYLAMMLEQTTRITDLIAPAPVSGSESVSEMEARAELSQQHRQFVYHLAYYLRKTSGIAFDKKTPKKGTTAGQADPDADLAMGPAADKATGKSKATKKGKVVDSDSELKIDKHMHFGPDKVYLKDTFWTSLSKCIAVDNGADAGAAAGSKTAVRENGSDNVDVGGDTKLTYQAGSPHSDEEQHISLGTFRYGQAGQWVGGAAEGNVGLSAIAARSGDGQTSSSRMFILPTKQTQQQPKMKDVDEEVFDNDGILEIRTQADAALEDLMHSLKEMHVSPDSQAGQAAHGDMDLTDSDCGMKVMFMCGHLDNGQWKEDISQPDPFSEVDQRNSSGSGTNNGGNGGGGGGGNTQRNRGDSTYADNRGSSDTASSDRSGAVVHSSNIATTAAADTNDDISYFDHIGNGHNEFPHHVHYDSDGSNGAFGQDPFEDSFGDFGFYAPDVLSSGWFGGSGDVGGSSVVPAMATTPQRTPSLRRRVSRAIRRTFRTPSA